MQNNMKLSFTIPGVPVAKARGRMVPLQQCKKCGRKTARRQCSCGSTELSLVTVLNTPTTETVHYENLVKLVAQTAVEQAGLTEPMSGCLSLEATAYFPIAESRRCKKDCSLSMRPSCKRLHDGDPHTNRPDGDNTIKSVMDGCNGVLWLDDSQVAMIMITKRWGANPRMEVVVEHKGNETSLATEGKRSATHPVV